MRIRNVYLGEAVIKWPEVGNRSTTVHHDDERPLAAKKVDKELEKSVEGECLDFLLAGKG